MCFSLKPINSSAFTRFVTLLFLLLSGSSFLRAEIVPTAIPVVSNGVEKLLPYVSTDASGYLRYRLAFDDKVWTVYYNSASTPARWEFQQCVNDQCEILSAGTSAPLLKYPPYGANNWTVAGNYTGTSGRLAITGISRPASPINQPVPAICSGVSGGFYLEYALGVLFPTTTPIPLVHVELSDVNGSFENPIELESAGGGSYEEPRSGSGFRFSEMGLTPGGNYKLRLRYYYGTNYYSEPFPLRIGPPIEQPVITPVTALPSRLCIGTDYTFRHSDVPVAAEYQWTLLGSNVGPDHVTTSRSGNTITLHMKQGSGVTGLRVSAVNYCGQILSNVYPIAMANLPGTFINGPKMLLIGEPQPYSLQSVPWWHADSDFAWSYSPDTDITITGGSEPNAVTVTAGPAAVAGELSVDVVAPGCPAQTLKLSITEVKKRRKTVSNGAWAQPATWEGGVIPGPDDLVSVRHQVSLGPGDMILDQPVVCQELRIDAGGRLRIEGGQLEVKQRSDLSPGQFRVDGGLVLDGGRLLVEKHGMVMGNTSSWAMSGGAEIILDNTETNINFSEISGNLAGFTETGDGGKVIVRRGGMVLFQGNPGQQIRGHYQIGDGSNRLAQDGQNFEIRAYAIDRLTLAPLVGSVNVYLLTAANNNIHPFYLNRLTINKSDTPFLSSPGVLLGYSSSPFNTPSSLVISGNLTNYARLSVNPVSSGTAKLIIGGILSPDGTTLAPTTLSTSITGNGEYDVNTVELLNQQGAVMSLGSNVTFRGPSYPDFSCQCNRYTYSLLINKATLNLHNYILKSGTVLGTGRIITGNGAPLTVNSGSSASPFNVTFPVGTGADSFTPLSIVVDRNGVREIGVGVSSSFSNPPPTAVNVGVQWNISGGLQPPAAAKLTFTWREEDESAGFDRSSVAIARFDTDLGEWSVLASGLSATTNPDGSFSVSVSGVTRFSAWGVFDSESALPVNLVSFEVRANEGMADLAWQTASESNSRHFEVERSADARQWNKIGQVAAKGERNGLESYSFTDPSVGDQPAAGRLYYRLKMVDLDGTFAYSPIRSLTFRSVAETAALLYPNPATAKVYLQNPDRREITFVTMYSFTGREVAVYHDKTAQLLEISHLPAGLYLLQIHHKSGPVETRRVVIGR